MENANVLARYASICQMVRRTYLQTVQLLSGGSRAKEEVLL